MTQACRPPHPDERRETEIETDREIDRHARCQTCEMSDKEKKCKMYGERERSYSPRVTAEEPGGVLGVGGAPWAV